MNFRLFRAFAALVFLAATSLAPVAASAQAAENPAHDEIRAMRDGAIAAFLDRDKAAFLTHFTDDVIFTAMNNEVVRGIDDADAYWDRMLVGNESLVENLEVEFSVDDLTSLYLDDEAGVAAGGMVTAFKMRAGLEFTVPLRWTAAMVREDGTWKVAALQFGANMFDNPLDSTLRKYLWLILAAALVVGLVVGGLFARRARR